MSATRFSDQESYQIRRQANCFLDRLYRLVPQPPCLRESDKMERLYAFYPPDLLDLARRVNTYHQQHPEMHVVSTPYTANIGGTFEIPLKYSQQHSYTGGRHFSEIPEDEMLRVSAEWRIDLADMRSKSFFTAGSTATIGDDHPFYQELQDWLTAYVKMRHVRDNAYATFEQMSWFCKTPGQWNTVFPSYLVLLEGEAQQVAKNQKRRSPWPKSLDETKLRPKLEPLAKVFAKCALLQPWHSFSNAGGTDVYRLRPL